MKIKSTILILTLALGLAVQHFDVRAGQGDDAAMQVANEMVQAWNEQDWQKVCDLFAEEGVLHSMMKDPVVGRDKVCELITALSAGVEEIELQIRNAGVINGLVVLERVDDFIYNGEHGRVPVVGVMEIADGQVQEWREYYDHETLAEALTPDPQPLDEVLAESEAEIRALTEQLQVDWNGGDMEAYLDAYWKDENTSMLFGNSALRGWQAIADLFRSSWTTEEAMGDFSTGEIAVRFTGTDIAIVSGPFQHVFPEETINGSFTHVWRRFEDGRWLIIHEHTSRG